MWRSTVCGWFAVLPLCTFGFVVFWWKPILWKQSPFQRVSSEWEWRPIFKVNRNQMEVRKGNRPHVFFNIQSDAEKFQVWDHCSDQHRTEWMLEILITFGLHVMLGLDQAFQSDTEQSRQKEATWRTWELLHLVHRSCGCWRWWARGGHQGWHLA